MRQRVLRAGKTVTSGGANGAVASAETNSVNPKDDEAGPAADRRELAAPGVLAHTSGSANPTPPAGIGEFVVEYDAGHLMLSMDHDTRKNDLPRVLLASPNTPMRPGDLVIGVNGTSIEDEEGEPQDLIKRLLSSKERPRWFGWVRQCRRHRPQRDSPAWHSRGGSRPTATSSSRTRGLASGLIVTFRMKLRAAWKGSVCNSTTASSHGTARATAGSWRASTSGCGGCTEDRIEIHALRLREHLRPVDSEAGKPLPFILNNWPLARSRCRAAAPAGASRAQAVRRAVPSLLLVPGPGTGLLVPLPGAARSHLLHHRHLLRLRIVPLLVRVLPLLRLSPLVPLPQTLLPRPRPRPRPR